MGGAGFVFTGNHDADILHNSALINLNVLNYAKMFHVKKIFYSSSACVYPMQLQESDDAYMLKEEDAYPVNPDSNYGYEKIFSERVYLAYANNYGMNVRIGRFHNIFGPEGTYKGGREKVPAALCRKVAEAKDGDTIELWGNGQQTRSFLYIDYCIDAVRDLMESEFGLPINIGSDHSISINNLLKMVLEISGKSTVFVKHIEGPIGVRGRSSNNDLFFSVCKYTPNIELRKNMEKLYEWVCEQIKKEF
jgi:nucleoside-diphosphate-sugar epimerase